MGGAPRIAAPQAEWSGQRGSDGFADAGWASPPPGQMRYTTLSDARPVARASAPRITAPQAGTYAAYSPPQPAGMQPGQPSAAEANYEPDRQFAPDYAPAPPQGYGQPAQTTAAAGAPYAVPDDRFGSQPAYVAPARAAAPASQRQPMAYPGDAPPALAQATGPRGTSGEQQRFDTVGYAVVNAGAPGAAVSVSAPSLAPGGFVEVTAVETGRTIIAIVSGDAGPPAGAIASLSPAAAQMLGATGPYIGVRVRTTMPAPADQSALRNGQAGSARIDAPAALTAALRRKMPASPPVIAAPPRAVSRYAPPQAPRNVMAAPAPSYGPSYGPSYAAPYTPAPPQMAAGGYYVQVAALSNAARAQQLAQDFGGGRIVASGGIHRVQIGPYANLAEAGRARDAAAMQGYGDARIVQ